MKMALEALDSDSPDIQLRAATALRAAIEQANKQEPVAWMWSDGTTTSDPDRADGTWTPLYTAPRQWVGLTAEEINAIYVQHHNQFGECISGDWGYERDIEAKLKEKNT